MRLVIWPIVFPLPRFFILWWYMRLVIWPIVFPLPRFFILWWYMRLVIWPIPWPWFLMRFVIWSIVWPWPPFFILWYMRLIVISGLSAPFRPPRLGGIGRPPFRRLPLRGPLGRLPLSRLPFRRLRRLPLLPLRRLPCRIRPWPPRREFIRFRCKWPRFRLRFRQLLWCWFWWYRHRSPRCSMWCSRRTSCCCAFLHGPQLPVKSGVWIRPPWIRRPPPIPWATPLWCRRTTHFLFKGIPSCCCWYSLTPLPCRFLVLIRLRSLMNMHQGPANWMLLILGQLQISPTSLSTFKQEERFLKVWLTGIEFKI